MKRIFIAGLFVTGISLIVTAIGALLAPELLTELPGGVVALFAAVFLGISGLFGGKLTEWADTIFGKKPDDYPPSTTNNIDQQVIVTNMHDGVIAKEYHHHDAPTPEKPASRLHQLPQPPADFTGREELIEQLTSDFKQSKGATISGLSGMGGIGKTVLGLEVAHKIADNYPDAQIFIDLKGTTTPLSAMEIARHVILSFEPTVDLSALDETNFQSAYQSVLHGKKVLLFFDNARSADQIAPLIPPDACVVLVTSRWTFPVPGFSVRRVDVMGEEEAKEFLLEICPRIEDNASKLAKSCAYLPLALRIAGSFLDVNSEWPFDEYISKLTDRKNKLTVLEESRKEAELTTEPSVIATFDLSYNTLSGENKDRWRALGVFPTSFTSNAANALWEMEENKLKKLLGLFKRYSLLEFDKTTMRYSLHDLLTAYAILQMENLQEQEPHIKHAEYFLSILHDTNKLYEMGNENVLMSLRLFDLEWDNIRSGYEWASTNFQKNKKVMNIVMDYPVAGIYCLSLRVHPSQQGMWLQNSIEAARLLGDKYKEAIRMGNLGNTYFELGNSKKGLEILEQVLIILKEIGDRRGEGVSLGNIGNVYRSLGNNEKAIEFYRRAIEIAQELDDTRSEGSWFINIGTAYGNLGKTQNAIEFFEKALQYAREIGDRKVEGDALGSLGDSHTKVGNIQKAIEFYNQALNIDREIGNRRSEGVDLDSLGEVYLGLGDNEKAIEFFEEAIVIAREVKDLRIERTSLINLGDSHTKVGDIQKAIEFYNQALNIDREIGNRRSEGILNNMVGNAYLNLNDNEKAIEFFEEAIVIAREVKDRFLEGTSLVNLGLAFVNLGNAKRAILINDQALIINQDIGNRISEGVGLGNLGLAYENLGVPKKAIEFYEKALVIDREVGNRRSEGDVLSSMGNAYRSLGDNEKAIEFYKKALAVFQTIKYPFGEGSILANLGLTYDSLGERKKAIENMKFALDVFERINSSQNAKSIRDTLTKWGV